ncbi:MAG: hypothetical protein BWY76_00033 [bacterium ADurb.Bin429]|nr:MAG: hypothetical protein BWY76_00033 [bacterium ADurb.Bin429]
MKRVRYSGVLLAFLGILLGTAVYTSLLFAQDTAQVKLSGDAYEQAVRFNQRQSFENGRRIFRFDTFGNERFWGDTLKLHQAIQGAKLDGVGDGVSPRAALSLGLKVDADALPRALQNDIARGRVNLDDPATTLTLLKLNAVVGVKGFFTPDDNRLRAVGITCALCHATVDDSVAPGIGKRLDGWANRDLNVGAIVAAAPDLSVYANALQTDQATVRKVLMSWGPGRYDAELNFDGKAFRPDGKSAATLIPPAYGKAGINLHTWTSGHGNVTYWNAYVAVTQMHGQGTFFDPRYNDPQRFPVAVRTGIWNTRGPVDLVTSRLPDLHTYQLALLAPKPPANTYNAAMATRGQALFTGKARCATCHVPPLFAEPGWNAHRGEEIGVDNFQADRDPEGAYVTQRLAGLWAHQRGGFYHDGRFATLLDVVNHYDAHFQLGLSAQEKNEVVEYLKSL